jgi:hypothetical protein
MCAIDPRDLRLSQCDNDIYDSFKTTFGDDFPLEFTPEEVLKSDAMKIVCLHFVYEHFHFLEMAHICRFVQTRERLQLWHTTSTQCCRWI